MFCSLPPVSQCEYHIIVLSPTFGKCVTLEQRDVIPLAFGASRNHFVIGGQAHENEFRYY